MHGTSYCVLDANNGQLSERTRRRDERKGIKFNFFHSFFLGCLLKGLGTSSAAAGT
jgi:hypothetical protein